MGFFFFAGFVRTLQKKESGMDSSLKMAKEPSMKTAGTRIDDLYTCMEEPYLVSINNS